MGLRTGSLHAARTGTGRAGRVATAVLTALAVLLLAAASASAVETQPKNAAVPTIGGTTREGSTLTVRNGSWEGGGLSYAYRWERCSSPGSCEVFEDTTAKHELVYGDIGKSFRVVVTASNKVGELSVTTAEVGPVSGIAPKNVTLPEITGTPREGDLLSTTNGTWSGSQATEYVFAWERCTSAKACKAIEGATNASYLLTSADRGDTVRVTVTDDNVAGSRSASSAQTAEIAAGGALEPWFPSYEGTTLSGWGNNGDGELGTGYHDGGEPFPVPAFGVQNVRETGEGYHQSIALLDNGTVMAWGGNSGGQLGRGLRVHREMTPGLVWAVGGNPNARQEEEEGKKPELHYLEGVTKISTGAANTFAVLANGTLAAWGGDQFGQLGTGHLNEGASGKMLSLTAKWPEAVKLPEGAKATSVAAGKGFAFALLENGTVLAWGRNQSRQLGLGALGSGKEEGKTVPQNCKSEIGEVACETVPAPVCMVEHADTTSCPEGEQLGEGPEERKVIAIWAGGESGYAELKDGELVGWGANAAQQLGQGKEPETNHNVPVRILPPPANPETEGIAEVAPGGSYVLARLKDGTVEGWGSDEWGQLTETSEALTHVAGGEQCKKSECLRAPTVLPALSSGVGGEPVRQIDAGFYAWTLVLTTGGKVYTVGHDGPFQQLGSNDVELCQPLKEIKRYKHEPPSKAEEEKRAKEERSRRIEETSNLCSRTLRPVMEHATAVSAGEMGSLVIQEAGAERPIPKVYAGATRSTVALGWTVAAKKFQIWAKTKDNLTEELEEEREEKTALAEELEKEMREASEAGETARAEELKEAALGARKEAEKLHEEAQKHESEEDGFAELNGKHPLEGGQYAHCSVATPCRFSFSALEKYKKGEEPKYAPLEPGKSYTVEVRAVEAEGTEENQTRFVEVETLP